MIFGVGLDTLGGYRTYPTTKVSSLRPLGPRPIFQRELGRETCGGETTKNLTIYKRRKDDNPQV